MATKGNDSERYGYVRITKYKEMTITVAAIQVVVAEQFGYQISYQKVMKAKRKAMTRLFGDWYKSYAELPRFFLAWSSQILDALWFAHCRPILSIDGTHLYRKYKGTLLIAMGCDGNNQLFPLAFAITEGENADNWSWFLACIRVGVTQRKGLCLTFDRHLGIIVAVNETYSGWTQPDACHRFCMRHLASNFNTKFKDKTLKDLMCRAAMQSKVKKFISHMDTIGRINAEARNWLEQIPLEKWALSYDGGRRYGIMTTNMSEIFNCVLKGAREEFTPHIDAKIKAKVVKAGAHEVLLYDHVAGRFHVKTRHSVGSSNRKPRTYHVTLQTGSCTYMDTSLFRARPNPKDTSALTLQHRHRSSTIRVDPDMGSVLTCRHRMLREWVLDDRVRPYIIQSGFYVFHRVGRVKVDWLLITALVERWRLETHTFHMPVGEMTITL
ncbi:Serine/threonine-protein phosphatase 7 long form-like [Vitis vinifera]|uniref:Serine/threonine-protein phosphatase 7 long form-like n=1 Tax=Vitis vinifera TaxID=29760 RepID=A0A438J3T1_VITVI|nr:Serine/threonine-protein phosphatase 7 long form-like [Vitis vinifera]